jgi:hypothetical protein
MARKTNRLSAQSAHQNARTSPLKAYPGPWILGPLIKMVDISIKCVAHQIIPLGYAFLLLDDRDFRRLAPGQPRGWMWDRCFISVSKRP